MIKKHNNTSIALGVPGLIVQVAGVFMVAFRREHAALGFVLMLVGSGLLVAGLAYYAMAKGRHPAWCLVVLVLSFLGQAVSALLAPLLTLLGYGVLGLLKDYSAELQDASPPVASRPTPRSPAVAAPVGRPAAFPDPAPGHSFNTYGVCAKCGCGRSAAHRPCTS
jgi:hypothetical protein